MWYLFFMLYFVTGGTIDKLAAYLPDGQFDNESRQFGESHLPKMLEVGRYAARYAVRQLFMIDSLYMTDEHRELIAIEAEMAEDKKIVVTHGTDSMPDTARYLKARTSQATTLASKTIVLTGAMVPFSVGETSDAMFNLGVATSLAQTLPAGVYVAMNGQVHEADNVRKDYSAGGVFVSIR
jgi:L-asparaginase